MWARPLLGPYVSDPSNNYVGIFVGVNYGGAKGWKYCWSQRIGLAWGRRVMHADFFTRGGVVGSPEGEGEFGRHIVSTHGEEKIWRRTGFLQVWGTVHNKSSCMPG